jgi:hypothetical protein
MADPEVSEVIVPPTIRVVAPKPRMTVYYALLIVALLAMLTACIFLYMVIRTFGGFGAVQGRVAWSVPSCPSMLVGSDYTRLIATDRIVRPTV